MTQWLLPVALVGGLLASPLLVCAQNAPETQSSASTQVEEIYVVRSVPESITQPTEFCAEERTGFSGATVENRFTFRSTATQATDGRMIDTNVKTIGNLHGCTGVTLDPTIFNYYAEGTLGSTPFKGSGKCFPRKADSPERGIRTAGCVVDLSGLPSAYIGGLLTTNSLVLASRKLGLESDPPGYTRASIATIRLWKKRDAPSSGSTQMKESLVGTWKLVSSAETNEKGEVGDSWGQNPTGFITFTADGRVFMIAARSGRKPFSSLPPPSEEIARAFALSPLMFAAYAGSYTLTDDKLISHIEACSVQNLVNTDQVRYVKIEGDRLTLRWETFSVTGGKIGASQLVWERMKPETTNK